ncbi:glycosyltransferase [Endozoicomonas arenosclerae]|uniref:glycosyltransferase n=1 Tax=Endozoicomonas arenosclerae TaxID=1633495 RepID=UPI0007858C46|nr:glycosyltransferase [Endozoicomonas arenosclerae]
MSQKLVVAQIVQHLAPGGIETMVLDLQRSAPDPEQVHIISLEGNFEEAVKHWPRLADVPRLHFLGKQPGIQFADVRKLASLLKTLKVDVIHSHHVGPMLYGGIAAKLASCRHVHTEHDAWHLANLKRRVLVGSFFHLLRPSVAADAELVADSIRQYIPLFKPSVIMNGIDTDRFQPGDQDEARDHLNLPKNVPLVGCAARLTSVKAHDVLISAFSKMPSDSHLALAGGGELEDELKEQAKQLNIEDRVHFMGVVEDMPSFFHAIDVFCLASLREGLPLSPLEAQACGRNIVLTDVGGCSEAVAPEGMLVNPGDEDSLAKALCGQIQNGCTTEARANARNFVIQKGNLTRMIDQYVQLYEGGKL